MTQTPLYMLHLPIESRHLFAFAADTGLMARRPALDTGYRLHALFAALFGPAAPKPFAIPDQAGANGGGDPAVLPILAYSSRPLAELRALAQAAATPQAWRAVSWDAAADKPMPAAFQAGLALGFQLRACPVVRLARGAASRSEGRRLPGAEVDAFLAARDAAGPGGKVEREPVYRRWLGEQFDRGGGARLQSLTVQALRRSPVFRRGHQPADPGKASAPDRSFDRPDVTFSGRLEVTDPAAFTEWLARGVGRHRAFGFGMLLLRPA